MASPIPPSSSPSPMVPLTAVLDAFVQGASPTLVVRSRIREEAGTSEPVVENVIERASAVALRLLRRPVDQVVNHTIEELQEAPILSSTATATPMGDVRSEMGRFSTGYIGSLEDGSYAGGDRWGVTSKVPIGNTGYLIVTLAQRSFTLSPAASGGAGSSTPVPVSESRNGGGGDFSSIDHRYKWIRNHLLGNETTSAMHKAVTGGDAVDVVAQALRGTRRIEDKVRMAAQLEINNRCCATQPANESLLLVKEPRTATGLSILQEVFQETELKLCISRVFVSESSMAVLQQTINLDWNRIRYMLSELIYNAFRHNDGPVHVTLGFSYDPTTQMLSIQVKDNGAGITEGLLTEAIGGTTVSPEAKVGKTIPALTFRICHLILEDILNGSFVAKTVPAISEGSEFILNIKVDDPSSIDSAVSAAGGKGPSLHFVNATASAGVHLPPLAAVGGSGAIDDRRSAVLAIPSPPHGSRGGALPPMSRGLAENPAAAPRISPPLGLLVSSAPAPASNPTTRAGGTVAFVRRLLNMKKTGAAAYLEGIPPSQSPGSLPPLGASVDSGAARATAPLGPRLAPIGGTTPLDGKTHVDGVVGGRAPSSFHPPAPCVAVGAPTAAGGAGHPPLRDLASSDPVALAPQRAPVGYLPLSLVLQTGAPLAVPEADASASVKPSPALVGAKKLPYDARVLFVDDEVIPRSLYWRMLPQCGFPKERINEATEVVDARAQVQAALETSEPFAFIFMDQIMSELGSDLAKEIFAMYDARSLPRPIIVPATGNASRSDIETYYKPAGMAYESILAKPVMKKGLITIRQRYFEPAPTDGGGGGGAAKA